MALDANIAHIELALEGKVDFIKKTNPFGTGEKSDDENEQEKLETQVPMPEIAARQIMDFVKKTQGHNARHKRKK